MNGNKWCSQIEKILYTLDENDFDICVNTVVNKFNIENEKLQVARENMKNDLAIAIENAKGRNKKKS